MSIRPRAAVCGFLTVVLAIGLTPVLAQSPEGVSPGAVDRVTGVEGRCPTFIWGGLPEATAYELVVYRLPDEPQASGTVDIDLSASDEILYSRVPGGATAWQPELADSLEPGGSYVWFVRAVLRATDDEVIETGDWSVGRFFSVPATPSDEQVRQALEVLQRWQAANGTAALPLSSAAASGAAASASVAVAVSEAGTGADADAGARTGASYPKSVPAATAAIWNTRVSFCFSPSSPGCRNGAPSGPALTSTSILALAPGGSTYW